MNNSRKLISHMMEMMEGNQIREKPSDECMSDGREYSAATKTEHTLTLNTIA